MSRFDLQWNATWGESPIHYVVDEAALQIILQGGVIKTGIYGAVFATPLRDFPPGGRVATEILPPPERWAGLEIFESKDWRQTADKTIWAHLGNVAVDPHPTLQSYQDAYGRTIVPVAQK